MRYFPVLQELFESDTVIILLIGAALGAAVSCMIKEPRRIGRLLIGSAALYALCEVISNFRTDNLLEILLLFAGTAAIGAALSSIVCLIIYRIKNRENDNL